MNMRERRDLDRYLTRDDDYGDDFDPMPSPSKSCLACRSPRTRPFGVTGSGQLRECMVCGAVYSSAGIVLRPSPAARVARIEADLNIEALQVRDDAMLRNTVVYLVVAGAIVIAGLFVVWDALS